MYSKLEEYLREVAEKQVDKDEDGIALLLGQQAEIAQNALSRHFFYLDVIKWLDPMLKEDLVTVEESLVSHGEGLDGSELMFTSALEIQVVTGATIRLSQVPDSWRDPSVLITVSKGNTECTLGKIIIDVGGYGTCHASLEGKKFSKDEFMAQCLDLLKLCDEK